MYARNRGNSPMGRGMGAARRPTQPPSPDRQPAYRQKVRVPPNYSGNAVVEGEDRVDLTAAVTPPLPVDAVERPTPAPGAMLSGGTATPEPRFDDLPRVSELGGASAPRWSPLGDLGGGGYEEEDHRPPQDALYAFQAEYADSSSEWPNDHGKGDALPIPTGSESARDSDRVASPPTGRLSLLDPTHFPFGHGLGFDELFLLGLILFLLMENDDREAKGDLDETVLLLGLLLFCG